MKTTANQNKHPIQWGIVLLVLAACGLFGATTSANNQSAPSTTSLTTAQKLSNAAIGRTAHQVRYDPAYVSISYPMGDVPKDTGVCTDVLVRSYRQLGVDLQKRVHEDMRANFSRYPRKWGLKRTDKNIDHRRVPNLRVFFTRHGQSLGVSSDPADYKAGDVVSWNLKPIGTLDHIGIVSEKRSVDGKRPLIVHNIGRGPQIEDMLFSYKITGHYRYLPETSGGNQ
jgi:uncharacterized protein YijF (DUF1287 family)